MVLLGKLLLGKDKKGGSVQVLENSFEVTMTELGYIWDESGKEKWNSNMGKTGCRVDGT